MGYGVVACHKSNILWVELAKTPTYGFGSSRGVLESHVEHRGSMTSHVGHKEGWAPNVELGRGLVSHIETKEVIHPTLDKKENWKRMNLRSAMLTPQKGMKEILISMKVT